MIALRDRQIRKGLKFLPGQHLTDPSSESRRVVCLGGLDCLLEIIRALRMGSCFSAESRSPHLDSSPTPALGMRSRSSKKRSLSRSSSADLRREERLQGIRGRMCLNGVSDIASLFTLQGKKGTNQDAMIAWENFGSRSDTVFCGVFDGHGPFGHMVAKRVRDILPLKLNAHWEVNMHNEGILKAISPDTPGSTNSEDTSFVSAEDESRVSVDLEGMERDPEILRTLKDSFIKAFKAMDRELKVHTNFDCYCSGTTAVTLIKQGKTLVIGNVGDSRAVLGTRDKDDSLRAVQLTTDLKPNLPGEAERIRKSRGRVFALQDEPDVARVWLPNTDSPGLAMSRAFGDFCLKDFGLISVPDIYCRHLSKNDEFVVLATDGIWDVLSNKEVVNIIASAPSRSTAARSLVESAVRSWRYKYPTSKIDDCAVVCLFLQGDLSVSSDSKSREPPGDVEGTDAGNLGGDRATAATGLPNSGTVRIRDDEWEGDGSKDDEGLVREWSALEGVSRVNTLLNLPRFVPGKNGKKGLGL